MTRVNLPIDSDLAVSSFMWAANLLAETPQLLLVSPEEDNAHVLGDVAVIIDPLLPRWSWVLQGRTREVYSNGG